MLKDREAWCAAVHVWLCKESDTTDDQQPGKDWGQEEKVVTEDEMAGWHHWLKGLEFEQTSKR